MALPENNRPTSQGIREEFGDSWFRFEVKNEDGETQVFEGNLADIERECPPVSKALEKGDPAELAFLLPQLRNSVVEQTDNNAG